MRRLLPGVFALALSTAASAQPTDSQPPRVPIRAWLGPNSAYLTDFGFVTGAADFRFMIERLGGPSAGVALGLLTNDEGVANSGTLEVGYGALLGGKSFDIGDAAFVNLSVGVGYGQGTQQRQRCAFLTGHEDVSRCGGSSDARGVVVPARLEVHITSTKGSSSFGASVGGMLTSPVGSLVGIGLHANLGRNLRGNR